MVFYKNFLKKSILLLLCSASFPVIAGTLRVQGGFWTGVMDSEMNDKISQDHIFEGNQYEKLYWLKTDNQNRTTVPVAVEYYHRLGKGELFAGASYFQTGFVANYSGATSNGGYAEMDLEKFNLHRMDIEAGYKIKLPKYSLALIPKIGNRIQQQTWAAAETAAGFYTSRTISSSFRALGNQYYTGLRLEYQLGKKLSLVGEWSGISQSGAKGKMFLDNSLIAHDTSYFFTPTPVYITERGSSQYRFSLDKKSAGILWKFSNNTGIETGFRQEKEMVSYQNYNGAKVTYTALAISPVQTTAYEYLTDRYIWNNKSRQIYAGFYIMAHHDFTL